VTVGSNSGSAATHRLICAYNLAGAAQEQEDRMKREERHRHHRGRWRISLFVLIMHILIYTYLWISAVSRGIHMDALVGASEWMVFAAQRQIALALFWTPFLLVHLGVHLYFAGRSNEGTNERQAYRDGFRDGAHYAEETYNPRRLTLDEALEETLEEDGELVEWEGKRKRSGR
jgi:hypothetical protein